ncbi:MAG: trimethylamine methyltransferase family protein [Actinobacteria bacterium]|nr:trimethylamine methyltransferase family protein [Actinomycetota bacterium]
MGWREKLRDEERAGVPRLSFDVLGAAGREAIHEATLVVLETAGVKVPVDEALDVLDGAGCVVDTHTRIVRFPRNVVEEALESAPGTILLASRDGERDYLMGGRSVGYTNFGEGTKVYDLETGEHRDSTLDDLARIARLCDALEMCDTFEMAVTPTDVPSESAYLEGFVAALRNTTKHVHAGVETGEQIDELAEIGAAVVGGAEALRERPIFSIDTCPTSPLALYSPTPEIMMGCARHGIASNVISMAMAGATGPISLSGTMVTHNAEVLSALTLAQLTRPGAPVIYGSSTTTFDLRHATAPVGAPELALISAAVAEMSEFYYLPCWVAGG